MLTAYHAIQYLLGNLDPSFLKKFRELGGLQSYPSRTKDPDFVDYSSGSVGLGAVAPNFNWLADEYLKTHTKSSVPKRRYFSLLGDAELDEGSIWEAAMSAGNHSLESLTVLVDYNKIQSYGFTKEVADLEPLVDKLISFGFGVKQIDGHNVNSIRNCLDSLPIIKEKPSAIICHTVKGKGFDFAENKPEWHHKSSFTEEEIKQMHECLNLK